MLKTIKLNSYFIIRAKVTDFKKQQKQMELDKINDATFDINLNSTKVQNFNYEDLKEYARKIKEFKIRIVKVKLKMEQ